MHPCQACGAAEVNDVGYCSNCRVYQGVTSYEAGPPAGDVFYQGAPTGSPAAVGVATPEVVYASGYDAAVYPAPAPVSGAAAEAPARARPALLIPLFVATVIMLLITSGTLVAFVLRSDAMTGNAQAREPGPDPATPAAASAAPSTPPSAAAAPALADDCLYGLWSVTYMEQIQVSEDANTKFSSGTAAGTFRFSPDGTGVWDLGGMTLTHPPTKWKGVNTGTITFTVISANQVLTFTTVKSNAQVVLSRAGEEVETRPLGGMYPALEYQCGGNSLRMKAEQRAYLELRRS